VLSRWFDRKPESEPADAAVAPSSAPASAPGLTGERVPRHSGAWAALRKRLEAESGLYAIDVGYTSPANIHYLTRLGHSIFLADLVADASTGEWQSQSEEDGSTVWNVEGFLNQSLRLSERKFDVVLLWTALDYLPQALVEPVVARLFEATNPGGQVLAFCHTRTQGEETAHCRFHVTDGDDVEVQLAQPFPIQRAFTNRSIKELFAAWSDYRQFLAKDSVSELIITR